MSSTADQIGGYASATITAVSPAVSAVSAAMSKRRDCRLTPDPTPRRLDVEEIWDVGELVRHGRGHDNAAVLPVHHPKVIRGDIASGGGRYTAARIQRGSSRGSGAL